MTPTLLLLVLMAAPATPGTWSTPSDALLEEGHAKGEGWKSTELGVDGVRFHLLLRRVEASTLGDDEIRAWVRNCAQAVTNYFGRFPVKELILRIERTEGRGVHGGVTYLGKRIRLELGTESTTEDLQHDWVLVHEFFHLGFPDLDRDELYLEEGLSTYLEPIARARAGLLSASEAWRSFIEGFPSGLPRHGDLGLDRTHTWGNTYWGGARFWLLADLEIRRQTQGARSLDDALKAILSAGGDGTEHWPLTRVLSVGDAATGTHVLRDLHGKMGEQPMNTDLPALWRRLGVKEAKGVVTFDDQAPEAALRRAITELRSRPGR